MRLYYNTFAIIMLNFLLKIKSNFQPYADNGGTVVGISGPDYCVLAADSRLSDKYMIHSRDFSRLYLIGENVLFGGPGCMSDVIALSKILQQHSLQFRWDNNIAMSLKCFAYLLSTVLYSRRGFPYYSFSTLAGLDEHGKGSLFKFDALGSFERVKTCCSGKGEQLIQPILDNYEKEYSINDDCNLWNISEGEDSFESTSIQYVPAELEKSIEVLLQAFHAAAEREITIGDGVEICIITSKGIEKRKHKLPIH